MLKMQYEGFVWPNNPRTYTIGCERRTVVQKLPLGSFVVQDLGQTCRVLRGEGEFYGPQAYIDLQRLLAVFQQDGPGLLAHPGWPCGSAYFTRLQLTQEPREDYVAYSFEFCEATPPQGQTEEQSRNRQNLKRYHTVSGGETLWTICDLYGMTMADAARMNPEIERPTALKVGQKVRVV